jgi:hypothetical protein
VRTIGLDPEPERLWVQLFDLDLHGLLRGSTPLGLFFDEVLCKQVGRPRKCVNLLRVGAAPISNEPLLLLRLWYFGRFRRITV